MEEVSFILKDTSLDPDRQLLGASYLFPLLYKLLSFLFFYRIDRHVVDLNFF